MFSFLPILENSAMQKKKKQQLLLARATMMLPAQASSVFLLSYRSTILNQSVHIFMLAINILLKVNTTNELIPLERRPFFALWVCLTGGLTVQGEYAID